MKRDRRLLGILAVVTALGGCAHRVAVELPATPAVSIASSEIAVVAAARECRPVADAIVGALNRLEGVTVDPNAHVRLEVRGCEQSTEPTVQVEIADGVDRRRVTVKGRAHALVAVRVDGRVTAHLIGTSATFARGNWDETDVPQLSKTVGRDMTEQVAADVAEQVRPLPRMVERIYYPRATEGTFHDLHNLAVDAERDGRVVEARRFAALAHEERPTARSRAYLDELDRRVARGMPDASQNLP